MGDDYATIVAVGRGGDRLRSCATSRGKGGKSREKHVVATDGRSSSSHYHVGGYHSGYLEPTLDAELICGLVEETMHSGFSHF